MSENIETQNENEARQKRIIDELKATSLDNEQFLDLLINKIADRAVEKVERTATMSRNRIAFLLTIGAGLFVTALTALATIGFSSLRESIITRAESIAVAKANEAASSAKDSIIRDSVTIVENSVSERIGQEIGLAQKQWDRLNTTLELTNVTTRINQRGGFSEKQAQDILKLLGNLANDNKYQDFSQFPVILEEVVDTFQLADRDDLVIPLEAKFGDVMLDTEGIILTMVESLGRMVAGYEALPSELGDGKLRSDWDGLIKRYHHYADAARSHQYPELPYTYDIILACMESQPRSAIEALIKRIEMFEGGERNSVELVVTGVLDEGWRATPDAFSHRVRERATDCLTEFVDIDPTGILPGVVSKLALSSSGVKAPEVLVTKPGDAQELDLGHFDEPYRLVHFWASWCQPCEVEFPLLEVVYQDLLEVGVELIAIDIGEDSDDVIEFVEAKGTSFPVYVDVDGTTEASWSYIDGLPMTLLVDQHDTILEVFDGAQDWQSEEVLIKLLQHIKE